MSTLERAIEIAVSAHKGQKDKAGRPYVLHPLRVMFSLESDDERIVGVLHDVVEDSPDWTFERLAAEGFPPRIIDALRLVTKSPADEAAIGGTRDPEEKYLAYEAFVLRAAQNPIGRRVKLADLTDNADLSRISMPTAADRARLERYRRAIAKLKSV
ncbi:MAG: GTP pyrophosphokinase [Alphaproteobacteria bacterium]|nr:GTP pyrophosphokinase [Alphaproteobacteria bacterium]